MTGVVGCIGDGKDGKGHQVIGEVAAGLMVLCGLGYPLPVTQIRSTAQVGCEAPAHFIFQLGASFGLGQSDSVGAVHLLTATHRHSL